MILFSIIPIASGFVGDYDDFDDSYNHEFYEFDICEDSDDFNKKIFKVPCNGKGNTPAL